MSDEREENRRRKLGKMWPTEVAFEDLPHHLQIHSLERSIERLREAMAVAREALEWYEQNAQFPKRAREAFAKMKGTA